MVLKIFDQSCYIAKRKRAMANANHFHEAFDYVTGDLEERLLMLKRTFKSILVLGARHIDFKYFFEKMYGNDVQVIEADFVAYKPETVLLQNEFLPFQAASFDCVLSFLHLHALNDVPGTLAQARHFLKEDGLFVSVMVGGETLYELREAMANAEQTLYYSVSPRIYPFMSTQDLGALLQRAGFSLPVVDRETVEANYSSFNSILNELRLWGETNCLVQRSPIPLSRRFITEIEKKYREAFFDDGYHVTIDLIWAFAWSPSENQQKPLKRGDFTVHMGDVLTKE